MTSPTDVRTPPAIFAPFIALGRQIRELFVSPLAFIGGFFGSLILAAGLLFLMVWLEKNAKAQPLEEEEFMMDFEPGALTKLGEEPEEIPEKPIHEELKTPDDVVEEAVTEEEEPPPEEIEKKDEPEKKKDDKPKNKNKDAKTSDKNQTKNNPYNDMPNDAPVSGDPFGDVNGWSDLKKDGDPWATAVMSALNNMKVPAWAGKLPAAKPYKFSLKVCKDGTVDKVYNKASSGNPDLDNAIRAEIERLKFPRPPAHIAKKMKSNCVLLRYQFAWKSGKVK